MCTIRTLFELNGCYGNKNGRQNRLKIENRHFGPNVRLLVTDFFFKIRYQHSLDNCSNKLITRKWTKAIFIF